MPAPWELGLLCDGERLFLLQEPSWLRVSAKVRDHWIPLMTARQFSKESMSTASEAGKNGFSLLFLKWLLENVWENSSLYNQKWWKFEINCQQLKILSFPSSPPPFTSLRTHSLFCSSMVVYLFLQHLFAAILGPLGKSPTYTTFLQDMVPGGYLLHTVFLGTCAL